MEECESRDNFDRYVLTPGSGRNDGGKADGDTSNQSQLKSSPDGKPANKNPKREVDDWSD